MQAAACVSAMAKAALETDLQPHLGGLVAALVECLQGRTWDGKENAVAALVAIVTKCKGQVERDATLQLQVGQLF